MARKIHLEKIVMEEGNEPLDYKENLIMSLRTPLGDQGIDYEEMGTRIPLMLKLKEASCPGSILVEEAEHKLLMNCLKGTKFRMVVLEIHEMIKSVIEAPEVKLKEAG